MKDKLIEKQKELIELMDRYFVAKTRPSLDDLNNSEELKSNLRELESQEIEGRSAEEVLRRRYDKEFKEHPDKNWKTWDEAKDDIAFVVEAMEEYAQSSKVSEKNRKEINCKKGDHCFRFMKQGEKRKLSGIASWICEKCGKIVQSM